MTDQSDTGEAADANLQNRDLLMNLVSVAQGLGHLPSAAEVDEHADVQASTYEAEFGDLYQALDEAGIVPDGVTRDDYQQATQTRNSDDDSSSNEPSREELMVDEFVLAEKDVEEGETDGEFHGVGEYAISIKNIIKTTFKISISGSKQAGKEMMRLFVFAMSIVVTVVSLSGVAVLYLLSKAKTK